MADVRGSDPAAAERPMTLRETPQAITEGDSTMRSAYGREEEPQEERRAYPNLVLVPCAVLLGVASLVAAAEAQQCPATTVRRIVYR